MSPIWPPPRTVALPKLLGGTITMVGYPLAMVYAEKITTALQRGTVNTRWRDFADLYILSGRRAVDGFELQAAMVGVAAHRNVTLSPLTEVLEWYASSAQARWAGWRRKQQLDDRLPSTFDEVLSAVMAFADEALADRVAGCRWDPETRTWSPSGTDESRDESL